MFVDEAPSETSPESPDAFDVERSGLSLSDVGGMREVKERLDVAFLTPMRNPELRALYGKSLKGGLLLYGPPGCGKTFIARAVAGELEQAFSTWDFRMSWTCGSARASGTCTRSSRLPAGRRPAWSSSTRSTRWARSVVNCATPPCAAP